jgi:hypothetical protein
MTGCAGGLGQRKCRPTTCSLPLPRLEVRPMSERRVQVFFHGSYMNFDVLRDVQITPERWQVARLHGFDVVVQPRANLHRTEREHVYGIVTAATHRQLERLYAHAKDVLGEVYLPEAVLTESVVGQRQPALCYIAPAMSPRPPRRRIWIGSWPPRGPSVFPTDMSRGSSGFARDGSALARLTGGVGRVRVVLGSSRVHFR